MPRKWRSRFIPSDIFGTVYVMEDFEDWSDYESDSESDSGDDDDEEIVTPQSDSSSASPAQPQPEHKPVRLTQS